MFTEIRELVDFLVFPMFGVVPRAKINGFAEEFANDLLITVLNENAGGSGVEIRKDANGFWILRDRQYVMPLVLEALEKCCISMGEFFAAWQAMLMGFKMDIGAVHFLINGHVSTLDLTPFKTDEFRFEYPVRVVRAMLDEKQYGEDTYETFEPPNFIPLQLFESSEYKFQEPNAPPLYMFRALGVPVHLCLAADLKSLPTVSGEAAVNGNSPVNVVKLNFFEPGWWQRGPFAKNAPSSSVTSSVQSSPCKASPSKFSP